MAVSSGISGIIISNTTISRPKNLLDAKQVEPGGLSGAPLFELSTQKLAQTFLAAKQRIPIIGVGGVDSAETAYTKVKAGASLIQLYTALIYKGPRLFSEIMENIEWCENPKFSSNASRVENRVELEHLIEKALSEENAEHWHKLLQKNGMNISHAAREAEIDRKYFRKLMKKYGIDAKSEEE